MEQCICNEGLVCQLPLPGCQEFNRRMFNPKFRNGFVPLAVVNQCVDQSIRWRPLHWLADFARCEPGVSKVRSVGGFPGLQI
jgi:hypothetical protein